MYSELRVCVSVLPVVSRSFTGMRRGHDDRRRCHFGQTRAVVAVVTSLKAALLQRRLTLHGEPLRLTDERRPSTVVWSSLGAKQQHRGRHALEGHWTDVLEAEPLGQPCDFLADDHLAGLRDRSQS